MSGREKFEANRETLAASPLRSGPTSRHHDSAFRRYLAAVSYQDTRSARTSDPAHGEGSRVEPDQDDLTLDDPMSWDQRSARVADDRPEAQRTDVLTAARRSVCQTPPPRA
jgi:hypothetical protein